MRRHILTFLLTAATLTLQAQTASPIMRVTTAAGETSEETAFDGSAPATVSLEANISEEGAYTPYCEWRFTRSGESKPFLTRYETDTQYTFAESGSFTIELFISFVNGIDTLSYTLETPFTVTISESKLEVPNAFSPNGDGVNEVFRVKEGYQSIISFHAAIFSRWGKKLYEWDDLDGGWDGRVGGHDAPDGGYYLVINARGADGRKYNIRKVINLLRGDAEAGTSTN